MTNEVIAAYIRIILFEISLIGLFYVIKQLASRVENYEISIQKPLFIRKLILFMMYGLFLIKIKCEANLNKSLFMKGIVLFVALFLFNLSYTKYFGWNYMPTEKTEWILDTITGLLMGITNWMLLFAFFPKRKKETIIQITKKQAESK